MCTDVQNVYRPLVVVISQSSRPYYVAATALQMSFYVARYPRLLLPFLKVETLHERYYPFPIIPWSSPLGRWQGARLESQPYDCRHDVLRLYATHRSHSFCSRAVLLSANRKANALENVTAPTSLFEALIIPGQPGSFA